MVGRSSEVTCRGTLCGRANSPGPAGEPGRAGKLIDRLGYGWWQSARFQLYLSQSWESTAKSLLACARENTASLLL